MGKNKTEFSNIKPEEESNKGEKIEQEIKNKEDIKVEYTRIFEQPLSYTKIFSPNSKFNTPAEKYNNKFDIHYPENDYLERDLTSRKESRDSTNDSLSYEDYYENDKNSMNINYNNNNNPSDNNKSKFSLQNKQKNKKQGPFKSTASDFKIKYKTELCKYYEINGYCKFGDRCAYAHGKENLRSKVTNSTAYRTRKCAQFFEKGYCPYGNRCQFAHQLASNIINNPYDRKMTYKKTLETISKLENVENIKELIEKPRLSVFKEIFPNKNSVKSTLFEDIKKINKEDIIERIDNN